MRATLRRARAFAGHLALLAALTVVAALLVSGVPRLANGYTDDGLRADLARLPLHRPRPDLRRPASRLPRSVTDRLAVDGEQQLDGYRAQLPAPLPGLIGGQWYTVRVGPVGVESGGDVAPFLGACTPSLSVRTLTGADRAIRLVEGRAPVSTDTVETIAGPTRPPRPSGCGSVRPSR